MNSTATSHFKQQLPLKRTIVHEAATVYFYENFVVVEVNEGVTLSYASGFSLLVTGLKHLGTKPWIYVSNRVNSYAVVPTDYKYLNRVPTLKGLVILNTNEMMKRNAELEQSFSKKPFFVAKDFDEALAWGNNILKNS